MRWAKVAQRPTGNAPLLSGDAGTSLVELLVAVVLLGIGVVGLLAGVSTLAMASGRHRAQATAGGLALAAAEATADPARNPYVTCAATSTYNPVNGITLPAGWSSGAVAVTAVRYWGGSSFGTTCYDTSVGSIARLQQIDVQVTSPDGRGRASLSIVKRAS